MSRILWTPAELKLLEKRSREGADNFVIATELKFVAGMKKKPEDVQEKRKELKLPGSDPNQAARNAVVARGARLPSRSPAASSVLLPPAAPPPPRPSVVFKAPAAGKRRTEPSPTEEQQSVVAPKEEKPSSAPAFAQGAAPAPVEKIAPPKERKKYTPEQSVFKFKVVPVQKCIEGKHYVLPGVGPMLCKGIDVIDVQGAKLTTVMLEQHPNDGDRPMIQKIPLNRLKDKGLRMPAVEKDMEALVRNLEFGESRRSIRSANSMDYGKVLEGLVVSPDLSTLAGLCLLYFPEAYKSVRNNINLQEKADKALRLIAAEYALVTGTNDVKAAYRMLRDKAMRTEEPDVVPEYYVRPLSGPMPK